MNYLFALNYETGTTAVCTYTGEKLEITETFLAGIEDQLLGANVREGRRREFRDETQREYTSRTLTQEIMVEGKRHPRDGAVRRPAQALRVPPEGEGARAVPEERQLPARAEGLRHATSSAPTTSGSAPTSPT